MSRYSEQFKRDAVALYENNEDLSLNSASAELGINRASLHSWVKKYGTGKRARIKAVHDKAQAANDSARIRQLEKEVSKLREERDILRKAAKYFGRRDSLVIRFQFVYDHRTEYSVKRMCHVLKLNRSSFYKWVSTRKKRRLKMYSDGLIGAKIKTIFDDEHGLYGAKRIAASLKEDLVYTPVNHKKVARIMKSMGLQGFSKRRRCITTRRKPGHRVMPDLVGRKFTANEPNRVYVGDITYLPCKGGKNMYVATVIDTYSRKLAGYALADHMRVSLVIDALAHAHGVRGSLDGAIFHSDHGSVYTSQAFRNYCSSLGVRQSMGAVGTSADNALAESFNATLKREVLRDRKVFDNPISCRRDVFRWCMRYNTRRRHSWCNLVAPDVFETKTSAILTTAA
ncbi:IS3 family transposase [Corynebacterium macginleyi]|uniref:IS3 family transposase n=2 Tax=Corynebacterium macginleyi TaxID=38290 RepID=UPI00190DEA0D|nr:IS3 family transposase [Corynebacterium macginleyi]QRJ58014.1 IS3 family transposase [Corynebacterium macginleyi]QRJ58488.1 IS3 family transposase [Corynebacterium macginleyi]QRJ58783.1 IS3 family transposase [Corynebacterium macginleyi]